MGKQALKKWEYDAGAIPGEPSYYYLEEGVHFSDADAAITVTDTKPPFYEAFDYDRNFIGRFTDVEEAKKAAENWVKETRIRDMLEPLRKRLLREFPVHHWSHSNVFSKFWSLYDAIKRGRHLGD